MSDMPESPTRRAPQFRGSTVVAEPRLARATSVGSPLGYLQPSRQPTAEASVDEAVVQVVTWSSLPACVGQVESVLFGEDSEMTRSRGFTAATTKLVSAERRQAFETFAARNRLLVFSLFTTLGFTVIGTLGMLLVGLGVAWAFFEPGSFEFESCYRTFTVAGVVAVPLLSIVFISSRAGMPKRAMAGLEAFFFLGFTAAIYKSATESLSPENRFDFSNRLQARNSGAILRNYAQLF